MNQAEIIGVIVDGLGAGRLLVLVLIVIVVVCGGPLPGP